MNKQNIIEFNKRFANGEQYIYLDTNGAIREESKQYYWQERAVYNHIAPIIEIRKAKNPNLTEEEIYGENGLVARLIPIQKAYNAIKNRKAEYLNKMAIGVLVAEDGSIDFINIGEEGICAGKIICYRQGSTPPTQLEFSGEFINVANTEEDRLLQEFIMLGGVK